jgi:protease stability complex PrcB-like protein
MRAAPGEEATTPVALTPESDSTADTGEQATQPQSPAQLAADSTGSHQAYVPYGSADSANLNPVNGNSGNLEIRRIGQWTHTGIREGRRLVIRDANTWAEFWSELGVGERPAVDFSRNLVIAVASGQRSSGGHEIAISRVTQTNGELTVEVVETAPGPNCMTTSVLTQPVDVIVVQGVNPKSWSFVERNDVRSCQS